MDIQYKCAKCYGTDYYMSTRNITSGYGWGIRGKMKDFPVCRVCDEIMHYQTEIDPRVQKDIDAFLKLLNRLGKFFRFFGKIGNKNGDKQSQFWRGLFIVAAAVIAVWGFIAGFIYS